MPVSVVGCAGGLGPLVQSLSGGGREVTVPGVGMAVDICVFLCPVDCLSPDHFLGGVQWFLINI